MLKNTQNSVIKVFLLNTSFVIETVCNDIKEANKKGNMQTVPSIFVANHALYKGCMVTSVISVLQKNQNEDQVTKDRTG